MTIDKLTAELAPHESAHKLELAASDTPSMPRQQIELPALEIEDDNYGGDPYNRTGQFCLADLKKRHS